MARSIKTRVGRHGTPVVTHTSRLNWDESRFIQGSIQPSSSRLIIRDEDGEYGPSSDNYTYVLGYHNVIEVEETASGSAVTLLRGRIEVLDSGRGPIPQKVERYREHEITVSDYNRDLFGIVVHNFRTRNNQTDVDQVKQLVSQYLCGSPRISTVLNGSNYVSSSNTKLIGSNIYSGMTPYDVLTDIAAQADKEFFVDVDGNLHYDGADSMAFLSSLRISDRNTDQSSNTFHPNWVSGAAQHQEGTDVVTKVRSYYGPEDNDGTASRTLTVTDNIDKWDTWEVPFFDDRSDNATEAERRAYAELRYNGKPYVTATCQIGPIPAEWAGYIKGGQRIQTKARAMPGAEDTFRWLRIANLEWQYVSGDPTNLLATIELERPRVRRTSAGGGPRARATAPGPAPEFQPSPSDTEVKYYSGGSDDPGGDAIEWDGILENQGSAGGGALGSDAYFFKSASPDAYQETWAATAGTQYRGSGYIGCTSNGQLKLVFTSLAAGTDGSLVNAANILDTHTLTVPQPGHEHAPEWSAFTFGPFTAPAGTTSIALGRTAGVDFDELYVFTVVDTSVNDEHAVDYGDDCPHESPHFLPSDYVLCRLDGLESATPTLLDDLADVDTPSPTDGQVLTWDSSAGEWIAESPEDSTLSGGDFIAGALSNPPTQAEVETLIGSPGQVTRGTVFGLQDSGTDKRYLALSDGVQWHIVPLVVPVETTGTATISAAPAGGWGQTQSAHYYNGKTYFAYVRGDNGNIEVRSYTHSTNTTSAATVMRAALLNDLHAAPSLVVRQSDHKIHAFYSDHAGAAMYQWVSTSAEDISAGTETNIDAQLGGTGYTYAMATDLTSGLYLWVRYSGGAAAGQDWGYSKTTDGGTTWAALTKFYEVTARTAYPFVQKTGADRVDVMALNGSSLEANTSIQYFSFDAAGNNWTAADGTALSLPVGDQSTIMVWDGASLDDARGRLDVARGVDDHPRILFGTINGTTYSYRHARWDGDSWVFTSLSSGTEPTIDGARFDSRDTNIVYLVDANNEILRLTTLDETTWASEALTTGTTTAYPMSPVDHAPDLPVMWMSGTITSAASYSTGTFGYGINDAAATADHLQRIVFLSDTTLDELIVKRTSGGVWQFSRDDGSSWEGLLSPVTITSPAVAERPRYDGTTWVNSALKWIPVTTYDGTNWLPAVDGSGNAIMTEA